MTANITFETLVYDNKAYDEFFHAYEKLIKWCKNYGFLKAAMDHATIRNEIKAAIDLLR